MKRRFKEIFTWVARIGADPLDGDEVRLQKALLVSGSFMFIPAGLLWGAAYLAFGESLSGSIPLSYALISSLSVALFAFTRRYHFFRFSQLLLILLLPFLLQLALGGFVNSSAVVLWSLICPFGALLFDEPRRARWWFLAYLALVILSGALQPYLRLANTLPPGVVLFFFVANVGAVSTIAIWSPPGCRVCDPTMRKLWRAWHWTFKPTSTTTRPASGTSWTFASASTPGR
jgi:guanylate cyclase